MGKKLKEMLKSRRGGIPTIITIIATTIAAMGLFSYTIMHQATSAKETGDKALFEQTKLNIMLDNDDYVTGKTVVSYVDRLGQASVTIYQSDGATEIDAPLVDKQAIFSFEPSFNEDGKLDGATFTRVNLGS